MSAVFKKEFRGYMRGVVGPLFISVILLFCGVFIAVYNLTLGSASLSFPIYFGGIALCLLIPVLTMQSMAKDRKNKTDMFYRTLPLTSWQIVCGKYLAMLAVFAIPTLIICLFPVVVGFYGDVDYLTSYAGIGGFFLLGAALLALGQFLSSLTELVAVAAVGGVLCSVAMFLTPTLSALIPDGSPLSFLFFVLLAALLAFASYLCTRNLILTTVVAAGGIIPLCVVFFVKSELFDGLFYEFAKAASPFWQFANITMNALIDLRSVWLFIIFIVFFLFAAVLSFDSRRNP